MKNKSQNFTEVIKKNKEICFHKTSLKYVQPTISKDRSYTAVHRGRQIHQQVCNICFKVKTVTTFVRICSFFFNGINVEWSFLWLYFSFLKPNFPRMQSNNVMYSLEVKSSRWQQSTFVNSVCRVVKCREGEQTV